MLNKLKFSMLDNEYVIESEFITFEKKKAYNNEKKTVITVGLDGEQTNILDYVIPENIKSISLNSMELERISKNVFLITSLNISNIPLIENKTEHVYDFYLNIVVENVTNKEE